MDSNQTEFKALEKSINVTDQNGFFDLFKDTRGDIAHAYLHRRMGNRIIISEYLPLKKTWRPL